MNSKDSDGEEIFSRIDKDNAADFDESVLNRLGRIEDAVKRESWLPMGLRSLIAVELPTLRSSVLGRGRFWRKRVAKQVLALALASWMYGPSLLDSETVSQLRVLDLELSSSSEEIVIDGDAHQPNPNNRRNS